MTNICLALQSLMDYLVHAALGNSLLTLLAQVLLVSREHCLVLEKLIMEVLFVPWELNASMHCKPHVQVDLAATTHVSQLADMGIIT